MEGRDARAAARKLLEEQGPPEAWQRVTREAVDAHLRNDVDAVAYWTMMLQELNAIAPRPGSGDLDIFRSARMLIAEQGAKEAWRHAIQKSAEAERDLFGQIYWLRIADAVSALARGYRKPGA